MPSLGSSLRTGGKVPEERHRDPEFGSIVYSIAMHPACGIFHNDKHFDWPDEITG